MLFLLVMGDGEFSPTSDATPIDEGLFFRIGQNDTQAFELLYHQTERAVYAFVLSMLRDPHDTCDVVQDTYLKIRASAHLYRAQGKPLAWIFTIAKNLSLSLLRRRGKAPQEDGSALEDDLRFSYVSDPSDRLTLGAALTILKEEERQILLLHAVSGVLHREIATALDLPLSTVLSKYRRALTKLKNHLTEQGVTQ